MRDHIVQVAVIQTSTMMLVSAFFIAFWVYFYISYEAISHFQVWGYLLVFFVCGINLVIVGPVALHILRTEMRDTWCTKIILISYIILCFLCLLPTLLLSNILGKGNWTKNYIHNFYQDNGRSPYLMDYIQKAQQCCGYTSFKDYFIGHSAEQMETGNNSFKEPVPHSCCSATVPGCESLERFIFKNGCFVTPGTTNEIIAWEHPFHGTGFLAVVLLPLLLPLFQMIQTCFLHDAIVQIDINYQKRRRESEESTVDERDSESNANAVCKYPAYHRCKKNPPSSSSSSSSSSSGDGIPRILVKQPFTISKGTFAFANKKDPLLTKASYEEDYVPKHQLKITRGLMKNNRSYKTPLFPNKLKATTEKAARPLPLEVGSVNAPTLHMDQTEKTKKTFEIQSVSGIQNKGYIIVPNNKPTETSKKKDKIIITPPEEDQKGVIEEDDILYTDKVHPSAKVLAINSDDYKPQVEPAKKLNVSSHPDNTLKPSNIQDQQVEQHEKNNIKNHELVGFADLDTGKSILKGKKSVSIFIQPNTRPDENLHKNHQGNDELHHHQPPPHRYPETATVTVDAAAGFQEQTPPPPIPQIHVPTYPYAEFNPYNNPNPFYLPPPPPAIPPYPIPPLPDYHHQPHHNQHERNHHDHLEVNRETHNRPNHGVHHEEHNHSHRHDSHHHGGERQHHHGGEHWDNQHHHHNRENSHDHGHHHGEHHNNHTNHHAHSHRRSRSRTHHSPSLYHHHHHS